MSKQSPGPIARQKLSDLVQERLLAEIRQGGLKPGDLLPSERELMAQYGVGRPAIREAMQNLQRMGLVEIRHGERPRMAAPSIGRVIGQLDDTMQHVLVHSEGSLDHLKEARVVFEAEMARIAAQRRTDDDLTRLAALLAAAAEAEQPSPRFLELDGQFHHAIARISGNPIFATLSASLFAWLSEFHRHLVQAPGHENVTLLEHHAILDAIARSDDTGAAVEMRNHLNRASGLYSVRNSTPTGLSADI